jgi:hypothetical protein
MDSAMVRVLVATKFFPQDSIIHEFRLESRKDDHWEDLNADWRILKLQNWGREMLTELIWLSVWNSGGSCEHGNESVSSKSGKEFE